MNVHKVQKCSALTSTALPPSPLNVQLTLRGAKVSTASYMLRPFVHPVACFGVCCAKFASGQLLATCKRTQQLPTMLGQQNCVCLYLTGLKESQVGIRQIS